jgi:hypothetical protein
MWFHQGGGFLAAQFLCTAPLWFAGAIPSNQIPDDNHSSIGSRIPSSVEIFAWDE